jgi:hypothetical protein
MPKVNAVPEPLLCNLAHSSYVRLSDRPAADLGAEPQEVLAPARHTWMFANHELGIRTLRLGVNTHDAAAVTAAAPVCIVAVPWPVRDEHLAEEELVPLLVYPRELQGRVDVRGREQLECLAADARGPFGRG